MRPSRRSDKPRPLGYAPTVPAAWQLLTDDPEERALFCDLDATLALDATPAGPPNRLRHVVRIEACGRRYYLKCFARTQWKNRARFATSRPRAVDDADRERRVTQALRAAGHGAPRPVAYGRRGPSSYYLCAELDGAPLTTWLTDGSADAQLSAMVAAHCGALLAAGFHLPDLSADHVFVDAEDGVAVLDLHNGGVGAPGAPGRKLLARVLRRFARSVRGLPVARPAAMRFGCRLLRAAGASPPLRRALLTGAQPFGTAARYEQPGRSSTYADRNPRRAAQERALLERVWPGRSGELVLDLPCGAGRLRPFLRARGHRVLQADGALAMLREAAARGDRGELQVQADALHVPFADRAVDGVVMFRFLHHLPPDAARAAMAEAYRVARRFVVLSFFHPVSLHHLQRLARQTVGAPATRFTSSLGDIQRLAAKHGFRLQARAAQLPFARDLWLAALVRQEPDAQRG